MAKQIAMTSDKKILVLNDGIEGVDTITVDSKLSDASTNPVQNKVVKAAIEGKQDKISANGLLKSDGTTIRGVAVKCLDITRNSDRAGIVPGHY